MATYFFPLATTNRSHVQDAGQLARKRVLLCINQLKVPESVRHTRNFRNFLAVCAFAGAQLISNTSVAQNQMSPMVPKPLSRAGESLCSKEDQIVFSCPLLRHKKVVSMCLTERAEKQQLYYVFGKKGAIEMRQFFGEKNSPTELKLARLFFAGATGGYAYSFNREEYKYIVYSISGTGFDLAGVLVQRGSDVNASSDLQCQDGKFVEYIDPSVQKTIDSLEHDRDLELHGLPHTRKKKI